MDETSNNEIREERHEAAQEVKESFADVVRFTFLALIIVIPFRMFIAQPFIVSGASMDPTFKNGDYLIVDQITPKLKGVNRGDVVVFRYPLDESRSFIKRVIGLPGETLEINYGKVTVRNKDNSEGIELGEPYVLYQRNFTATITLKDTEYFVMGDNREGSLDSRIWGPLEKDKVIGRPVIRLLPLSKLGLFPGEYTYEKADE